MTKAKVTFKVTKLHSTDDPIVKDMEELGSSFTLEEVNSILDNWCTAKPYNPNDRIEISRRYTILE